MDKNKNDTTEHVASEHVASEEHEKHQQHREGHHDMGQMKMESMAMDHTEVDHSHHEMGGMKHDHHEMSGMDHSHHDMSQMNHDHQEMSGMDHSMHMGNFKQKFWLSLVLAIPIILLSPMMGIELPFQFSFPGSEWVVLVLGTVLFFYGGAPFLKGAKMELQMKSPAMMTLIAMGISVAYIYSLYAFVMNEFFHGHVMNFFWELATLIVIMLLGHWIEMNAVMSAGDALAKLAELLPSTVVRLLANGQTEEVPLSTIQVNERLLVRAGDKVPTDGIIEKGESTVDESALTGESRGVVKKAGDKVIGGSLNGNGTMEIRVTGTGESGYLAKVMEMVRRAQQEKSQLEGLADKVAKWLFYVALGVGLVAFVWWLVATDLPTALERMVTVFIIACPHALGLAVPLVVARSTSIAAKNGLLLKNRTALENAHALDEIYLDKTGTLTAGTFKVTGVESLVSDYDNKRILALLGALEANSTHPIATGIMKELAAKKVTPLKASDVKNIAGLGLTGQVDGQVVQILNAGGLAQLNLNVPQAQIQPYAEQGNTVSFLVVANQLVGLVALGDQIKPTAKQFITELQTLGIEPVMLTGDNQEAAASVAEYLGLKKYHASLLPEDKEKIIATAIAAGKRVAMVGDGINDAPSLARATVGIAIGAGTDIAVDSADVVLTNSNPQDILNFLQIAQKTRRKMIQNLWWGAGYNILALPLAAGVLAPIGILLSPAVGAVLMSLSTVIVALNALTLHLNK
ncbi:heavy metal translocating P-type ATPase [Enterococcus nangangensis]|uniref:heavy metal translocating P-type ATPase n=1 Tax=Enterococcus nangangensis TaxID=2559926 RepID=UPI0035310541